MTSITAIPHRTHLSLAVSRAWAVDHPVGDPFGGPAFGQREMPVVAVAAVAMGATALATTVAISTFAAISAWGAIIGGVGALTGNKTMTKVGMVMGLVGGVGAWGSTAGNFADGQALWDDPFKAAAGAGDAAAAATDTIGAQQAIDGSAETINAAAEAAAPNIASSELVIGNQSPNAAGGGLVDTGGMDGLAADTTGTAPALVDNEQIGKLVAQDGLVGSDVKIPMNAEQAASVSGTGGIDPFPAGATDPAAAASPFAKLGSDGLFDSVLKFADGAKGWIKDNQLLASTGLKAIEAGFKDTTAEDRYRNAASSLVEERALSEATQRNNANYVPSVSKYFPANAPATKPKAIKPLPYRPAPSGLMSS